MTMTELERNKTVARRYLEEVWGRGNLAVVDELIAADYRGGTRGAGQKTHAGPDGLKQCVSGQRAAFPDGTKTLVSLTAEDERVVAEMSFAGTHAATGRRVSNDQVFVLHLRDGRIVSEAVFFDVGGTLAQLKG